MGVRRVDELFDNLEANETASKIVTAVEKLLLERDIRDISIREIAQVSGVNIAAVNYHFGSKDALTYAVFDRLAANATRSRIDELHALMTTARAAGVTPDIAAIISSFIRPYINGENGQLLARLILRHRVMPSDVTRAIVKRRFDELANLYIEAIMQAFPDLTAAQASWRYSFMMGSVIMTVTDLGRIGNFAAGAFAADDPKELEAALMDFLTNGMLRQG